VRGCAELDRPPHHPPAAGKQALAHGLVDELGGLGRAIELAKQQAGLPLEEDAVQVVEYPPKQRVPALLKMLARCGPAGAFS
jgi:ClpP class serine protease